MTRIYLIFSKMYYQRRNAPERGIEANPEKITAITSMGPIKDLKGVQRVMGCLVALSRFISRLGERGLPLYRMRASCRGARLQGRCEGGGGEVARDAAHQTAEMCIRDRL